MGYGSVSFLLLGPTGVGGVLSLYGFPTNWLHLAAGRAGGLRSVGEVLVTLVITALCYSVSFTRGRGAICGSDAKRMAVAIDGAGSSSMCAPGCGSATRSKIAMRDRSASSCSDACDCANFGSRSFSLIGSFDKVTSGNVTLTFFVLVLIFNFPVFIVFVTFCFHCGGEHRHCGLMRGTVTTKRPVPRNVLGRDLGASAHSGKVGGVYLNAKLFVFL